MSKIKLSPAQVRCLRKMKDRKHLCTFSISERKATINKLEYFGLSTRKYSKCVGCVWIYKITPAGIKYLEELEDE